MIAMNRMAEQETEVRESTLFERVEAYLRFLRTPQAEIPYEKRLFLKRKHIEALEEAVANERRAGFTLIEMLVAVALVVLMMTLFATIFQMATSAMSVQKGLAENDQRVRLVLTRLRNDLNGVKADPNDPNRPYRTFRNLVPYGPDETGQVGGTTDRLGYFYISENDPNDDTDDVLALTVQMPSSSSERFIGRASIVFPDIAGNYGPGNPNPNSQPYWPNQPEFDDIQGTPNQAGASNFAEVCYFLRRGTLYRRFMLIRQPNTTPQPADGTPTDATPVSLNMAVYSGGTRNFWTDFDYSAFFNSRAGVGLDFHGTGSQSDSLSNSSPLPNPFVLGNPAFRWGFDCTTGAGGNPGANYGQPREYVTSGGVTYFIGRFTQAETSDLSFGYPGNLNGASGNPMDSTTALNYNTTTGAVSNYAGSRAGEDVLMTNVIKFDIKVFDPAASSGPDGFPGVASVDDDNDGTIDNNSELGWPGSDDGDFRDIGHNGSTGFYSSNPGNIPQTMLYFQTRFPNLIGVARPAPDYPLNTNYSNPNNGKNRFDTWNPKLDFNNDGMSDRPPFRPFNFGPDGKPGLANIDDDGNNVTDDIGELGWVQSDDQPEALRAIQIKITFYDRTSKQVREATLVQSLLYTP